MFVYNWSHPVNTVCHSLFHYTYNLYMATGGFCLDALNTAMVNVTNGCEIEVILTLKSSNCYKVYFRVNVLIITRPLLSLSLFSLLSSLSLSLSLLTSLSALSTLLTMYTSNHPLPHTHSVWTCSTAHYHH